jgi:hypothetical protein
MSPDDVSPEPPVESTAEDDGATEGGEVGVDRGVGDEVSTGLDVSDFISELADSFTFPAGGVVGLTALSVEDVYKTVYGFGV